MTSVERVLEYCEIEPEAPPVTGKRPPSDWPPSGSIIFKNMSLKYAPHLKNVLHRICCHIRSNEKVSCKDFITDQPSNCCTSKYLSWLTVILEPINLRHNSPIYCLVVLSRFSHRERFLSREQCFFFRQWLLLRNGSEPWPQFNSSGECLGKMKSFV